MEEALLRDDMKAIVLIGSNGKFSAGFDATAFGGSIEGKSSKKKPIIAAIEGPVFGGALEIALTRHARISTTSVQLGLTELEYGKIPGLRDVKTSQWRGSSKFVPYIFLAPAHNLLATAQQ